MARLAFSSPTPAALRRGGRLVLAVALLDGAGIGMVYPILPALLRTMLPGAAHVARQYGLLVAAFAVGLFAASPLLGSLSDRFGRRPLLLFALAGAAADNLILALAPALWVLYVGRMVAGLTGASLTVTNAYMADITPEGERSAAFGRLNAAFGVGFILGPVMGALLGSVSLRSPFYAAALLNGAAALGCLWLLPESRQTVPGETPPSPFRREQLNPFSSLLRVVGLRGALPLFYVFSTMALIGQITGVLWVLYGPARLGWSTRTVGFSLALYGALYAVGQSLLPALAKRRLGGRGTVVAGLGADAVGFALFSAARTTPAALGVTPLFALGGVALPALQSILSGEAGEARQGELQGVLTSINGLTAVLGPLAGTALYTALAQRLPRYPGAIWLFAVVLYTSCLTVMLWRGRAPGRTAVL